MQDNTAYQHQGDKVNMHITQVNSTPLTMIQIEHSGSKLELGYSNTIIFFVGRIREMPRNLHIPKRLSYTCSLDVGNQLMLLEPLFIWGYLKLLL